MVLGVVVGRGSYASTPLRAPWTAHLVPLGHGALHSPFTGRCTAGGRDATATRGASVGCNSYYWAKECGHLGIAALLPCFEYEAVRFTTARHRR